MRSRRPWSPYLLAAGMGLWAVSALGGGAGLLSARDGSGIGFDPSLLSHTPFDDFFLPGVILTLLGVGGAAVCALVVRALRDRGRRGAPTAWQWSFALIVALGHLGWMVGEIVLLWSVVAGLPGDQRVFFYGFWWSFGLLSAANLLLVLARPTRRLLGGR